MVDSPLGKIPEGWEAINILALIEERKARNTNDETLPVLSVTNNRVFVLSDDYFSKRVYSQSLKNYKLVEKDDFAFNPARVNIGSIAMLDNQQRGLVSPMYSIFRAHSKVLPSVLWVIINEERTMEQIRKLCFGTVRQIFKLNDFQQVMIVLPSIAVQRFWLLVSDPLEQQAKLLHKKNDILRQTRDLLLPKLISGELDVSELDITIPEANA
jgi:type I restriction enzyme S subunit